MTNDLLAIKDETQKRLNKAAEGSLEKYVEQGHQNIQKAVVKYGLQLKYGKPNIAPSVSEGAKTA